MMKEPAGNRIVFPHLGPVAMPSEGKGMYSWEYVQAITFLLARCANIAESLSIEHPDNRRSKRWTSRLQSFLGFSPSVSNQTVEGADAQVAAPAGVSERLLVLCNELVDGGNDLGKAISKRESTSDWHSGRFPCKELGGTYGAMKTELEDPMKKALDNTTVVDATVVAEWAKSAKQLIEAAMRDTEP